MDPFAKMGLFLAESMPYAAQMRWLLTHISAALLLAGLVAVPAHALSLFEQPKYAALLVDADTGEILYSRQADAERFPASITKVMTLYMVFERLAAGTLRLEDRVTFSRNAAAQAPSKLGLKVGQSLTVDQAIRALTTKSANDVAVAVAEHIGGTDVKFGQMMTARAQQLGMSNSRFVNPNGLPDPRQVTTARDIYLLSKATIEHFPQYYHYFQIQQFSMNGQVMPNHNHLLRTMSGVDGIKTGFTRAAGFTLTASAVRDGKRLIAVVLGGPTRIARDANVETLLTAGFSVMNARQRGQLVQVADVLAEPADLNDALLDRLVEQGSSSAPVPPRSAQSRPR